MTLRHRLTRTVIFLAASLLVVVPVQAQDGDDADPAWPSPVASAAASGSEAPRESLEPLEVPQTEDLDRRLADSDELAAEREALVERAIEPVIDDTAIIEAMHEVPRHAFVPTEHLGLAYNDHPLPIGYGQTISQPSLVALMTQLLGIDAGDRVLEVGTGSGYQAAILGEITDEVYSVEIVPELAGISRAVLDELGYGEEVAIKRADGYFGWPEYAPFDAIVVTAAPDHLPRPLVNQLEPEGGRMVIPIGPVGDVQTLWLVTRAGDEIDMERLIDVTFVPFTRDPSE